MATTWRDLKPSDLVAVLAIVAQDQRSSLQSFESQSRTFLSSIGLVTAVTATGVRFATSPGYLWLALLGPIFVYVLAVSMERSLRRHYRRFLITISTRAKIETALGMHVRPDCSGKWTEIEALIYTEDNADRHKHRSAMRFVQANEREGVNKVMIAVSQWIKAIAIAAFLLLALTAAFFVDDSEPEDTLNESAMGQTFSKIG